MWKLCVEELCAIMSKLTLKCNGRDYYGKGAADPEIRGLNPLKTRIHCTVFLPTQYPVLLDQVVAAAEPKVGPSAVRGGVG